MEGIMKKLKNRFGGLLTAGAVLLVLSSCGALSKAASGDAALTISFQNSLGLTMAPEVSMDAELITVTVTSPNGGSSEYDVEPDGYIVLDDLVFGTYTICAAAYNADGILIGGASATVELNSGERVSVVLNIRPLEGEGTLSLSVFWDETEIQTPLLNASLLNSDGTTTLDMTIDGAVASCETTLDAGYYSLSVSLYDDDYLCFGWMEIVRIITDQTTTGELDFTDANINGGSIEVAIDVNLENPLTPVIGNASDIIGVSEPMALSASVEEDLSDVSYVWYLMGEAVRQGDAYIFMEDEEGTYRIDLAAFSSDGSRAGSTGFSVYVSDEVSSYIKISEVQGASHTSPMVGETIEDVLGVVTAVEDSGFWMQSPAGDGDSSTSEGIYVYTYSSHSQEVGDLVLVDGTVKEYGYSGQLKLTELTYPTVEVISTDYPLPDAVVIGKDGILPPTGTVCDDAVETVYDSVFDPDEDAIDFFESLESMRVEFDNPVVIGATTYGEIPVIPAGVTYDSATARGGLIRTEDNVNPQLLYIDYDADILGLETLSAGLGDYFTSPVTGVMSYDYGLFMLLPTEVPSFVSNPVEQETSGLETDENDLVVATFNILNFPRDDESMNSSEIQAKIEDIAYTIATALNAPDIIGLQEMTDDSYSDDDGTVGAADNAQSIIDAVVSLGGPSYEYLEIAPNNNDEGGWEGANIRVGYLYNPSRVGFTAAGTPMASTETEVVDDGDGPSLTLNPGRFSVDSFKDSRRPLAAQFEFNGEKVFLVNNHLCSKSGDDYIFGENQPPVFSSETERHIQAEAVRDFVNDILDIDADANVIVLGDLNDYSYSETLDILKEASIESVTEELLDENERYSYFYYGNCQQLDHILATSGLMKNAQVDIVHRYAEYDSQVRESDHDPVVAAFSFDSGSSSTDGTLFFSEYGEGSSYNKYVEIYNPGSETVDLNGYTLVLYSNGSTTETASYSFTEELAANDVLVIANPQSGSTILGLTDIESSAVNFNGDDCMRLLDASGSIIDQIGIFGEKAEAEVAGTASATKDHTLVRKPSVLTGNAGDWSTSAGTDTDDSEWIVYDKDCWDYLGSHSVQ